MEKPRRRPDCGGTCAGISETPACVMPLEAKNGINRDQRTKRTRTLISGADPVKARGGAGRKDSQNPGKLGDRPWSFSAAQSRSGDGCDLAVRSSRQAVACECGEGIISYLPKRQIVGCFAPLFPNVRQPPIRNARKHETHLKNRRRGFCRVEPFQPLSNTLQLCNPARGNRNL